VEGEWETVDDDDEDEESKAIVDWVLKKYKKGQVVMCWARPQSLSPPS
jgi:hypothetical protein